MKPKYRALLYNFIGFTALFIIARLALGYFLTVNRFFLAVTAAVIANVLAPKFWVSPNEGKLLMKWFFNKSPKEI